MAIQQTFEFDDPAGKLASEGQASEGHSRSLVATAPTRLPHAQQAPHAQEDQAQRGRPAETAPPSLATDREKVLRQLRAKAGCLTTATVDKTGRFSTGSRGVDHLLPGEGLRVDGITEWVADANGCGAASLAVIAAATRLREIPGPLVVVAGEDVFYPPAAVALGIPAERIIWVRPTRHADVVWSIDQALRCATVASVWSHVGPNLDDRDARRFQLAAETGGTPGLFVRPSSVRGRPSFADVRFHVAGKAPGEGVRDQKNRVMRVTLDRCRGGVVGQGIHLRIDDQLRIQEITPKQLGIWLPAHSSKTADHETATVRLASQLAHPTTSQLSPQQRRA